MTLGMIYDDEKLFLGMKKRGSGKAGGTDLVVKFRKVNFLKMS